MIALIVAALILVLFGFAEARLLDRVLISQAPPLLGAMVLIGVAVGIRRMPQQHVVPWVLIALGWLTAIAARFLGWQTVSVVSWFAFGIATLGYVTLYNYRFVRELGPDARRIAWIGGTLIILTLLILLWR